MSTRSENISRQLPHIKISGLPAIKRRRRRKLNGWSNFCVNIYIFIFMSTYSATYMQTLRQLQKVWEVISMSKRSNAKITIARKSNMELQTIQPRDILSKTIITFSGERVCVARNKMYGEKDGRWIWNLKMFQENSLETQKLHTLHTTLMVSHRLAICLDTRTEWLAFLYRLLHVVSVDI